MITATEAGPALLTVDACILADDDNHVLCSIRIPKSTIASNHLFLAALSEQVACRSLAPPPFGLTIAMPTRGPPKKKSRRNLWVTGAAAFAFLTSPVSLAVNWALTLSYFGYAASADATPAIAESPNRVLAVQLDTPKVPVGGTLQYTSIVQRKQECFGTFERIIYDRKTRDVVLTAHRVSTSLSISPDPQHVVVKVRLPESIPVGLYTVRSTQTHQCDGATYHTNSPSLDFEVI